MRENFLTIPVAPNYEINSQLICRNKRTKRVLTLQRRKGNHGTYYSLRLTGTKNTIKLSPKLLRRLAAEAANPTKTFMLIPSLDYRYEINMRGVVRNAKTKQVLKRKGHGKCIVVHSGKHKYTTRAITDLLWEVHGIIKKRRFRPVPCSAENHCGKFFFPNLKACARFLAPKLHFSVGWVHKNLTRRAASFCGWQFSYKSGDSYAQD